jgi:uncharacterized protein
VSSAVGRPLPVADRDSMAWWTAVAEHTLQLQRCDACGALRWPARAVCNRCGALEWAWVAASGRATVASWVVTRHQFSAAFEAPYCVVLARLDEQDDILVPGAYGGPPDGQGLRIGQHLVVAFDDVAVPEDAEPISLLRWMPIPDERR